MTSPVTYLALDVEKEVSLYLSCSPDPGRPPVTPYVQEWTLKPAVYALRPRVTPVEWILLPEGVDRSNSPACAM